MPIRSPITVAVAHFEDLLALGLRALLAEDPSVSVIAQDVAYERIPVVLRAQRPRVLILDVARLRDLAQVRTLSVEHPYTHLVLLGAGLSAAECAQLLAFGASACLPKDTQARDVRNAIHLASRGLQLMPRSVPGADATHVADALLTRREGEVLGLLRQGRSNAQIAVELGIGVETVRTHARRVYRKLGVSSRRALVALAGAPPAPPPRTTRRRAAARTTARRPLHS
jgi:DNA-binding NarL/FixJ family response regulator